MSDSSKTGRDARRDARGMRHGDHHYFVLHTDDPAASEAFFSRVLGWETDGGEITNLAFLGALSDRHPRAVWIHVDDTAATCDEVARLGGTPGPIVEERSGPSAACVDDQGNAFHVGTLIPEYRDHPRPEPRGLGELGYLTYPVGDTERAVGFYGSLFGWEFEPAGSAGIQPGYRHVRNGSIPFGVTTGGDVSPSLYFRVADAAAARGTVSDHGGRHGDLVDSETGRTLTGCVDPAGVRFELWQPAPGY